MTKDIEKTDQLKNVQMELKQVKVPGYPHTVPVCVECLSGTHLSYGFDHRTGIEGRQDCKNVSDDGQKQCNCSPDWPELYNEIERLNGNTNNR